MMHSSNDLEIGSAALFKWSVVILGVVLLGALATAAYFASEGVEKSPVPEELSEEKVIGGLSPRDEIGDIHTPIESEFENKIVYGTSASLDEDLLRDHCAKRGGTFNTCGSPCAEGEICVQVCALTCEF